MGNDLNNWGSTLSKISNMATTKKIKPKFTHHTAWVSEPIAPGFYVRWKKAEPLTVIYHGYYKNPVHFPEQERGPWFFGPFSLPTSNPVS